MRSKQDSTPRSERGRLRLRRSAAVERKTKETQIRLALDLDGAGSSRIQTPIPFLSHMLELFAKHGLFDLTIRARGDTAVDDHHTVEDLGIVLGEALKQALGDKRGIRRYGMAEVPMDEALSAVHLDLSGRPYLVYRVPLGRRERVKGFDVRLLEDFFQAFVMHSGTTLHVNTRYGRNVHHILEGVFKAFGKALDLATQIDPRVKGIPSTKGRL